MLCKEDFQWRRGSLWLYLLLGIIHTYNRHKSDNSFYICIILIFRKDIYTSSSVSANDIRFEIGAVLYNIGALHTQLGAADSRNSADGMKLACTHFQCAAWAFQVKNMNKALVMMRMY